MTTSAEFDVYCDETRPELLFGSPPGTGFAGIGSLWMPHEYRDEFKVEVRALRREFNVWGEVKWSKVSPANLDFHAALVRYFMATGELRFRAIMIDATKLDMTRFHSSDSELGFYKFYYQLLTHWCSRPARYQLYCDEKVNRDRTRLATLGRVLRNANPASSFPVVQAVRSSESSGVQVADLLLGAVQSRFNTPGLVNAGKIGVLHELETRLGYQLGPTPKSAQKVNVFRIALQGRSE